MLNISFHVRFDGKKKTFFLFVTLKVAVDFFAALLVAR